VLRHVVAPGQETLVPLPYRLHPAGQVVIWTVSRGHLDAGIVVIWTAVQWASGEASSIDPRPVRFPYGVHVQVRDPLALLTCLTTGLPTAAGTTSLTFHPALAIIPARDENCRMSR
jgi:hypothetical protein